MNKSTLQDRIDILSDIRIQINPNNKRLQDAIDLAKIKNPWFTNENCWHALMSIRDHFLDSNILQEWTVNYDIDNLKSSKTIALILAGNIPLVGFHDVLCVFISGHKSKIKYSEKDDILIPFIIQLIIDKKPELSSLFERIEKLENFDAVIATGSNNSSRYFDYYFSNYPHIIRKHRNAVAILTGDENDDDLLDLANDVFQYFGLGCRNISKLYVPIDYSFDHLLDVFHKRNEVVLHNKYKNNFDYSIALYLLNQEKYLNNGCIILIQDHRIASRISCLHYEFYDTIDDLKKMLLANKDVIQCVSSRFSIAGITTIKLGKAQKPSIDDYADDIDTLTFLSNV